MFLKLGSLSFSAFAFRDEDWDFAAADADPLPAESFSDDLGIRTVKAPCTLGPMCWKNFGMTGRQLMQIPVASSA